MKKFLIVLCLWSVGGAVFAQIDQAKVDAFVKRYAANNSASEAEVKAILDKAVYQPKTIEKITRPAEGMSWKRYRNIFMTEERISAGVDFWKNNQAVLEDVSQKSGVDIPYIVSILGVETYYGDRKGGYKVLDALYTLAFGYPKRSTFFSRELEEFLLLVEEEGLNIDEMEGSYAGAMGYCQFMPSSYRAYAKSYSAADNRDLVNNVDDAIASAANYLKVHRWKTNAPVAVEANPTPKAQTIGKQSLKPKYAISHYTAQGYVPATDFETNLVTLIKLDNEGSYEYWFGAHNFYVITRYNHSSLYAMAVHQLAEAIADEMP